MLLWFCVAPVQAAGQTVEDFLGRHDERGALGVLQTRIDSKPKDLDALRKISCIYLYFSDFKAASAYLSMALRLSPNDKQLHFWRGVCLYRIGKPESALKDFLVAVPQPNLQALRCYAKLNRFDQTKKLLAAMLADGNWANDDDISLCVIAHDFPRAMKFVNERSGDPTDRHDYMTRGDILLAEGKWQDALNEYDRAASLVRGSNPPYNLFRGRATALRALGKDAPAADEYKIEIASLRRMPLTFRNDGVRYKEQQELLFAYRNLAELQRKLGRLADADSSDRERFAVQSQMDEHRRSFYTLGDVLERPEEGLEQDPDETGLSNAGYDITKFSAP